GSRGCYHGGPLVRERRAGGGSCDPSAVRRRDRMREITRRNVVAIAVVAAGLGMSSLPPGPVRGDEPGSSRKYLLERVDDAAVAQLYADGFSQLPLSQKTLIWHLYQAALAGRDIYYDQRHELSLTMRALLEAILTHSEGVEPGTLTELRRYTKLFWINSGPYNHLAARKIVLKCSPSQPAAAGRGADRGGAALPPHAAATA